MSGPMEDKVPSKKGVSVQDKTDETSRTRTSSSRSDDADSLDIGGDRFLGGRERTLGPGEYHPHGQMTRQPGAD